MKKINKEIKERKRESTGERKKEKQKERREIRETESQEDRKKGGKKITMDERRRKDERD